MQLTTQYITNNLGETISVILPIEQFKDLIKLLELNNNKFDVPQWHKEELDKRKVQSSFVNQRNYNTILDELISSL